MTTKRTISFEVSSSQPRSATQFTLGASCVGLTGYIMFHSIPGTGAVRSLFLLLMLAGLSSYSWLARPALRWPPLDMAGKILLLLTAWIAFQSGFLAVDGLGPLKTFTVEWSKNLLMGAIGIWLARAALFAGKGQWVFVATFCGFFAHVLGTLGYQAWYLLTYGKLDFFESLLGNYGYVSPIIDGAVAIAFADATGRVCFNRSLLPLSDRKLGVVFFLAILALVALTPKASWLNALLMLGLFATITAMHGRRYRKQILAITFVAAVGLTALGALVQGRWNGALDSIRYGQAIEEHTIWKGTGEPLPGHIIESFYLRTAWGIVGLRGLAEHPLGRGYGSNAFGRYLSEKYGIQGGVSSHSGWLDFALANGIPGLLLLLAFSGALCVRSWRSFVANTGIGGLALAFLTISYISRCMIDGQISTSKLMAFALVSGVLWGLTWTADLSRKSSA
jgi:hypothetical protein